mmetsp:Transcript_3812/g.24116  ORF Transcript_3812/g.24116 Transcript_3812/m.24116 type:complete len:106 (-) Transcript_3812:5715-6032(-)
MDMATSNPSDGRNSPSESRTQGGRRLRDGMDARHPSHAILKCFLCRIRTPLGCNDLDVGEGGRTHHDRKHTLPKRQIQGRTTGFFAEEAALARHRCKVDRRMRGS